MLEEHPHPNPNKAREGKRKHRLILDPVRAPIVLMIFEDYCLRLLGLGAICDKLNRDLDRFPPPQPNRKDENGLRPTWSRSVIRSILRNPKYTGYNVWGRHDKRKGRPLIRPREEWVWSPTTVHEPIVTKELFEAVEERAAGNAVRAKLPQPEQYPQRRGRRPGRFYPLRGRVRCGLCGRRMEGSHQKGSNWYRCQYVTRRGHVAADMADHPRVLGIKEANILAPTLDFLARRIFGPERLRLLQAELAQAGTEEWCEHDAEQERLQNELQGIDRSLHRQTLRLEEHEDPDHPVVALATRRIEELSARRRAVTDAIDTLKAERPTGRRPDDILAMLDAVPDLRPTLSNATDAELADLFDAFDATITYDKPNGRLTLAATIHPGLDLQNDNDRPGERSRSLISGVRCSRLARSRSQS
ncbi:MAG: recombinase family protein [Solirubrobacteraceae bacterium]